ncbi:MAG: ATP-dependent DNA helicase [bacterium]|nr:ATP-dependent DNA helicase [bacterium]
MTPFETEMQKLNPRQREAVENIEGPVMVVAGPGTGKTQILTLRIANILARTDTPAEAILALTFTEAASANMRRRLVALIGSRGYYVRIGTFHGFCNALIQQYPEKYPAIMGGRHCMPADAMAILRAIIEEGSWTNLRPFAEKFYYVPEILKAIKDIKREGFGLDAFAELVKREKEEFESRDDLHHTKGKYKNEMKGSAQRRLEKLNRNKELSEIYVRYQEVLRTRKLYDFDDMILETIKAMESDKNFLLELQERYQYILVDEHQDTNGAQNKVLELLASFYPNPNLFVVGDEKQAIFRFQGASLDNFLYFKNKYADAKFISLEENYRSTQTILDSAQSLIEKNKAVLSLPLRAARPLRRGSLQAAEKKGKDLVQVWKFSLPEAELLFLAGRVKELFSQGVPWKNMGILYRENRDALPIADFFAAQNIPFVIESDRNVLANRLIMKLVALCNAIWRFGEDEALARILHIDFLALDPMDIYRLIRATDDEKRVSLWMLVSGSENLDMLGVREPAKIKDLYEKLARWKQQSENEELAKFISRLMRESGFLEHALKHGNYAKNMEAVGAFFDEVKKISENHQDAALRDLMEYLEVLRSHGATIRERGARLEEAVRLMTAHKAKGLEFEAVFIVGASDGHWGNKRSRKYFELPFRTVSDVSEMEKNEDERRLFYMALTRAKRVSCITYSQTSSDGRELVPSQFIEEIRENLREAHAGDEFEKAFSERREAFMAPPHELAAPGREYFSEIFRKRGLNATALNNYLSCPWRFFYQNLLRWFSSPTSLQIYGIAAHKALQMFFDARNQGKDTNKNFLLDAFRQDMAHKALGRRDKEALIKKGGVSLGGYFDAWHETWSAQTINEFRVPGVLLGKDIKLTGNLDKLELDADGRSVAVVDYKTKQPQSRNWIEGKTRDKRSGQYKRQLVFYKLLLDLKPEKTYHMKAGIIDFLEPDERGKYRRELFEITEAEKKELIETIERVADEITHLKFWNRRCDEKDCEFCRLRALMDPS